MKREDTIKKYIDAFLKGRSEEKKNKFKAKPLNLQYASIMQWRRNIAKRENTPKSTKEILDTLRKANSLIENSPSIEDEYRQAIEMELDSIRHTLDDYCEKQRQRRIDELEARQRDINAQLQQLRNN